MFQHLSLPRFAPPIEAQFQASYYARIQPTLRLVSGVLAATLSLYLALRLHRIAPFVNVFTLPYLGFCLLLLGLTYAPAFGRVWQSVTVVLAWVASAAMLFWFSQTLRVPPPTSADPRAFEIIHHLVFVLETCVLMIMTAALRLQWRPTIVLQSAIVLTGVSIVLSELPVDLTRWNSATRFLEPVLLVWLGVLLAAFVQEQLARRAFEANRELAQLQEQERQKRVETEKTLHILNGAIGGVVHDLGNPLTSVQSGSELLGTLLRDPKSDTEMCLELNDMVLRGAKMLNFLRLSLIEQSRVLEGQPVPVELKSVSIRAIVEAGASFQKPRFSHGHELTLEEQDYQICADEMKLVTVTMNLIGNALKYSDGQVRIAWETRGELLFLAVLDQGKAGRGLTQEQAECLFTAFGRLETHANIEGTGLGLMSVQKIIEAHGGAVWIEGYGDGTPASPRFSTAPGQCPALLNDDFRTAFALSCPLAS